MGTTWQFFFLFSFSFTVYMSGFNQWLLCETLQLGLSKLFALLSYRPVDYRWNSIKRLQRLIMPESFQYYPRQLTLSAHYINNLGEAVISKAGELRLPSPCTVCLHFKAFTHGCTFCLSHLCIQISLLVSCTSCVWHFFHMHIHGKRFLPVLQNYNT